jgi:hypothetical protein
LTRLIQDAGLSISDCNLDDVALGTKRPENAASDTDRIVRMAWDNLPPAHRGLLESIGASQWKIVEQPLGEAAAAFLRSGGHHGLARATRDRLNDALGIWIRELNVVLINDCHPKLRGLSARTVEEFISRVA